MAGQVILFLLRLSLAGIFVVAGVRKIWDFDSGGWATQAFYQDILNYHLEDLSFVKVVLGLAARWHWNMSDVAMLTAVYLPWLEIVVGVALFIRQLAMGAAALVGLMTVLFIVLLGSAWLRGLDISCGCFGHENATADFPLLMARDVAMLLVAALLFWMETRAPHPQGVAEPK